MNQTAEASARMGALLVENQEIGQIISRVRRQRLDIVARRDARGPEIAELEERYCHNNVMILDCETALHEARLAWFDACPANDPTARHLVRVLKTGLNRLRKSRADAEGQLRATRTTKERLLGQQQSAHPDANPSLDGR